MEIVVCVKQVPDSKAQARFDEASHTLTRDTIATMVNLFDKNAVEEALRLKEKHGGRITLISMGPPNARLSLEECLGMGADRAVLISDDSLSGSDSLGTARILANAIKKLERYDIIICGKHALDSSTGHVGPQIAEYLDIPQVTCAAKIDIDGDFATVQREHEGSYEVLEVYLPMLVTVVKAINEPRWPTVEDRWNAIYDDIPVWTPGDLGIPEERIGLKGAATTVRDIKVLPPRTQGVIIRKNTPRESVEELIKIIVEDKIVITGR